LLLAAATACGVDIHADHVVSAAGGEDGVDPAAGARVEHPVALADLGEHHTTEEVRDRARREHLLGDEQLELDVADSVGAQTVQLDRRGLVPTPQHRGPLV
jgi:hypothetical protein